MAYILKQYNSATCHVAIEFVCARPGEGVISIWSFASAYWTWLGICSALNLKVNIITPQTWKKTFKDFKKLPKDKASSIVVAKKIFPTADIKFKYHHGRADALLLAEFARLQYVMEQTQVHASSV
jgi:hypothetical protein